MIRIPIPSSHSWQETFSPAVSFSCCNLFEEKILKFYKGGDFDPEERLRGLHQYSLGGHKIFRPAHSHRCVCVYVTKRDAGFASKNGSVCCPYLCCAVLRESVAFVRVRDFQSLIP